MLFSTDHIYSPYGEYIITTAYLWSNGILQMPLASSSTQNANMVQVNQPLGSKLVLWSAERDGAVPTLPGAEPRSGEVLSYSKIMPRAPKLMADGENYIYGASGIYSYFLTAPLSYSSGQLYYAQEPVGTITPQTVGSFQFALPAASSVALFSSDHCQHPYTEYETETEYVYMSGVVQQPITSAIPGNGNTCELIQTSSPYGWRVVKWKATRLNAPPVLPVPVPNAAVGEQLNYYIIRPESVALMADGVSYIWSISGEYWFWSQTPYDETITALPMGLVGYDGGPEQVYLPGNFDDNLIRT